MAHSRNDLIREGVEAEVDHNVESGVVDGVNRFVMREEAIVDLVMSHVDPLVEEIDGLKARLERAEALVNQQLGPCTGCVEAPEEYCPRHGRSYNDMATHLEGMIVYERGRVVALEDALNSSQGGA